MTQSPPLLHHVVFAVAPERLDEAAAYLTALGFEFQAFEHEEPGLQVRLDRAAASSSSRRLLTRQRMRGPRQTS